MDLSPSHRRSVPSSFPRTRGDGPLGRMRGAHFRQFPPHARGWTLEDKLESKLLEVSPARAGMDPS